MPLLILDVDGVLTDGTKYYGPDGKVLMKRFADIDFTAIKKFVSQGWAVVLLSADTCVNQPLAKDRDIPFYCSREEDGTIDKVKWYHHLIQRHSVAERDIIYVGDDMFDIPIMNTVTQAGGRAYCPSNSAPQVRKHAIPLAKRGGEGAIMELYYRMFPYDDIPPCH